MKICVFLTNENTAVLNAFKTIFKRSRSVKIIDRPICDLQSYLSELEKKNFKQVIIRYNDKISFSGIFIDVFIIDPDSAQNGEMDLFKYGSRDSIYILSSDYENYMQRLPKSANCLIDFGLNSNACITASSISEENFMCSITRTVKSVYNHDIEEQEMTVKYSSDYSIEQMLMIMSALIILGFLF